ncbi:hypothetical protein F4780DRAFT_775680 [Xylariomycetidae sp. FL0641]|nr:hypothetical protein F4780DRAFT_775680 [Xylariomycetidae sp. FL0641]
MAGCFKRESDTPGPEFSAELVTIEAPSGKEYVIHARPLAHFSTYFRRALNSGFADSKSRHFKLVEHCNDDTLDLLTRWVYERSSAHDTDMNNYDKYPQCIEDLVSTWLLGDYLGMPTLQNDLARLLVELSDDKNQRYLLVDANLDSLWPYLKVKPKLRDLLLDQFYWAMHVYAKGGLDTTAVKKEMEQFPVEVLVELASRLHAKVMGEERGEVTWDKEDVEKYFVKEDPANVPDAENKIGQHTQNPVNHAAPTTNTPAFEMAIRSPFQPFDLRMGDDAPEDLTYVPFKLVQKYPSLYTGTAVRSKTTKFFTENLLANRVWDFFFLIDPATTSRGPLLLVPSDQFEQFLGVANAQLKGHLAVPSGNARARFYMTFGQFDAPLPRFLGRANSQAALDFLKARISKLPYRDEWVAMTDAGLQNYKEKMDDIYKFLKDGKSKQSSEAAVAKRMQRQKGYGRMLKRTQRYLGLRPRGGYAPLTTRTDTASTWDPSQQVPFKARESMRFVCVDVEAYERDANVITEIGFAVLDTEDTMDVPPGESGRNWFSLIKTFHFRVKEYEFLVNRQFVDGCPDAFNFGQSEFVPINMINRAIGRIIGDEESDDTRPVIMVGHDIQQDLRYLRKVGFNVWRVPHFADEVDTKSLAQRMERGMNGRGLETICNTLGIMGRNFHNAGNDAYYTMCAMIALAIKRTVEGPGTPSGPDQPPIDEWSDGEMDDGGPPEKSPEYILPNTAPARRPQW